MRLGREFGQRLVALALVGSLAMGPAAAQVEPPRAVEGDWSGFVSFVSAGIPFRGSFAFTSSAGEVEGTFQWSGAGTLVGGVVTGPDTMPRFDLNSVTSGGVDVPDVSGGGEIMFTLGTCERLEGTGVNIDVARMVEVGSIVWWAVRSEAAVDMDPFLEALRGLRDDVSHLLDNLEAGVVTVGGVFERIVPSLADAELLASRLDRSEGCGEGFYRSLLASEVERLLLYALAHPDVAHYLFASIVLTALRAGVIGSGSEFADGVLEIQVRAAMEERILTAIEGSDTTELTYMGAVAEDLGWNDLAADVVFALEAMAG